MNAFNGFFKDLATKMGLPDFFRGSTLLFNNLFLLLFTILCVIALVLVIVLVPGKKKKSESIEKSAHPEPVESAAAERIDTPVTEPVAEDAPVTEPVVADDAPVEEISATEDAEERREEETHTLLDEVTDETVTTEPDPVVETPVETVVETVVTEDVTPEDEVAETTTEEGADVKNGGKYEIVKRNGAFYFLLKANNGQLLLESSSYTTLAGVKKGIESFKNAVEVGEFSIDEDKNGNFKFILRASARSQMLYHGETYGTRQSAENAIRSVKNFAFKSVIKRMEENDEEDTSSATIPVEIAPLAEEDHKLGGKYEIEEREGNYYFLLKANNGQLLLESPAFASEQGAKGGIETFKKAADSGIFVIDQDKNGNFRFILRANARASMRYFGESYSTRQSAESSVHSVRAFAQKAILK